ncbi:hypothetical protein ACFQX6_66065 [Streptosporangium lutulentum]
MSGYDGDHVEIHGTFHDKVFGKVGTYIEHYHPRPPRPCSRRSSRVSSPSSPADFSHARSWSGNWTSRSRSRGRRWCAR